MKIGGWQAQAETGRPPSPWREDTSNRWYLFPAPCPHPPGLPACHARPLGALVRLTCCLPHADLRPVRENLA